jgi:hypothetical protein
MICTLSGGGNAEQTVLTARNKDKGGIAHPFSDLTIALNTSSILAKSSSKGYCTSTRSFTNSHPMSYAQYFSTSEIFSSELQGRHAAEYVMGT